MEDFFESREKPNIFRKIYIWWKFDGRYYHQYLKHGIKNLWYWFPIIWKDRDWDHHFIFELLKHKLKSQSDYIDRRDFHTRAQKDARDMRTCIKLIQLLQDGKYEMEYMDYEKTKHWLEPCNDGTDNSTWETENIWERYDDYFKKYPLIYKRVLNGEGWASIKGREDDKHFIAMSIGHLNQERAHSLLFKIMKDNINGWWD